MRLLGIVALLMLCACAPDAERAKPAVAAGDEVEVVNGLMEAFNAHDPDRMRNYWSADVTWVEVTGNQSSVVTSSADQLHSELVAYFESYPTVSSSLSNIAVNGKYVTAVETPVWEQDGERKSQSSIVVYEISNGKVRRFWYFPPQ